MKLMADAELGLVEGRNPQALAEQLAEDHSMTVRTVERYFRLIRERWKTEEEELRPGRRAQFRAMIMENLRLAWATANPIAGAATLRILAKLDGLEEPTKVEITGGIDVRAMAPHERRDAIDELIAKRARAQKAKARKRLNGANGKVTH